MPQVKRRNASLRVIRRSARATMTHARRLLAGARWKKHRRISCSSWSDGSAVAWSPCDDPRQVGNSAEAVMAHSAQDVRFLGGPPPQQMLRQFWGIRSSAKTAGCCWSVGFRGDSAGCTWYNRLPTNRRAGDGGKGDHGAEFLDAAGCCGAHRRRRHGSGCRSSQGEDRSNRHEGM